MLTNRYLASAKNLPSILAKLVDGVAPDRFTNEHLVSLGFSSSNDRAIIPLLKDLGFLTSEGAPTQRYQSYRDRTRSKQVLGEALREAYEDIFHIREIPLPGDREAIEGVFRTKLNSSQRVAELQASTFLALLGLADVGSSSSKEITPSFVDIPKEPKQETEPNTAKHGGKANGTALNAELHYTIQIHLPATKDIEVFNAIFRSLRENLLT